MFWQMVSIENKKVTKRSLFWIELAVVAILAILLPLSFYLASQSPNSSIQVTSDGSIEELVTWPFGLNLGLGMTTGSGLGGLLIVILVGALTAQEYGWRTMQLWLSRGIARPVLLLAKFTAVILPAFLFVCAAFLASAVTTAIITQSVQGSLPFDAVAWGQVVLSIVRTAYTLLPYAALTFFLAIVSRSTVVAVGVGLGYTMLAEGLARQILGMMGGFWADVASYLPGGLSNALTALNRVATTPQAGLISSVPSDVSAETAVIGIALYTILFVGLAMLIFRRQDLGG